MSEELPASDDPARRHTIPEEAERICCHCFGKSVSTPVPKQTIVRAFGSPISTY